MRKRFKILIAMCVALVVVAVVAYFRVQPRSLADAVDEGTLRVVTNYDTRHFVVTDCDTSGFQYELMRAFAHHMGLQMQFTIEADLNKNIEGLNAGDYDVVMKLLPTTTELKDEVALSMPIAKDNLVLVQRRPKRGENLKLLSNVADLDGKVVFLPSGSPDALVLRHIEEELGIDLKIEYLPDIDSEHLLAMVATGQLLYATADAGTFRAVKAYYPTLDGETILGFDQWRAWAFSEKNIELRNSFDDWFADYRCSAEYENLFQQYFGK